MVIPSLIQHKRDGHAIAPEDWARLVADYTAGRIPDYQISALLMAIVFRGLAPEELSALTDAMLQSGDRLRFDGFPVPRVDKHSTGGVGDKVSLLLAPMVAACGVAVPMMSGRGLGHTGGTLDKLEADSRFSHRALPRRGPGAGGADRLRHAGPDAGDRARGPEALRAARCHRHGGIHSAHLREHHVEEAGRRAQRAWCST